MHYLINSSRLSVVFAVAFAIAIIGCEGKTGPAGPSGPTGPAGAAGPAGPQGSTGPAGPAGAAGADGADGAQGPAGPAGADGADGATGPAGPAGPAGPQGPAGDPGSAGAGSTVHHIALVLKVNPDPEDDPVEAKDYKSYGIDDSAAKKILRVEEELMIYAAARTQNGSMIDDVKFDWDVTEGVDPIEHDPSDDTMTNTVEAVESGKATLRVTAIDHNISADIVITVTGKPDKVTVTRMGEDDPADTSDSPEALQIGDTVVLTAAVKNGVDLRGGNFGWSSDDEDVAEVIAAGDNESDNKAMNTITATGRGAATITVSFEGAKVAKFNVRVSGSRNDRVLSHIITTDTFELDRGAEDADRNWDPATLTVEAILEDADGDPLVGKTVTASISGAYETGTLNPTVAVAGNDGTTLNAGPTGADGTVIVTVTAPTETTVANISDTALGTRSHTLTLKTAGANDEVIIITTTITDSSSD